MIASLPTALLVTAVGSAILAVTLWYLSRYERRSGPGWWAAAMTMNALRQATNAAVVMSGFMPGYLLVDLFTAFATALFLMGAIRFTERPGHDRLIVGVLLLLVVFAALAYWLRFDPMLWMVVAYGVIGIGFILSSLVMWGGATRDRHLGGAHLITLVFFVAGLHSLAYPFLLPFPTWRLLVSAAIGLGVAIGLIVVIQRRQAFALTAETQRADRYTAELKESELRFRDFAEVSSDWLWETDADLRFTFLSENFEKAIGIDRRATLGRRPEDMRRVSVESDGWDRHLADLAARRAFHDFRFIYRTPDGRARNLVVNGKPVFANGRFVGYRGAGRDETEAVETIEQVSALRQRLLEAFNSMPNGVALFDRDDRLITCNPAYISMSGVESSLVTPGTAFESILRDAVAGNPVRIGQDIEAVVAERLRRHIAGSEPTEVKMKTGRWCLVQDYRLGDGGSVVVLSDISIAKLSEQALADKTQLLQSAIENMGEGIAVFDADLRLVMWNERRIELGGVPRSHYRIGAHFDDFIRYRAEQGEYGNGDVETFVRERSDRVGLRAPYQSARWSLNGRYIVVRRNPMPDGGVIMVLSDLTESKRTEEALREAKETAETANRTKSEILANMSHELRTPLNAIIGFSEIIMSQAFGPVGQKRYLDYAHDIYESGTHLLALINDILDVSKAEAGRIELLEGLVDLTDMFDSCIRLVRPRADEAGVTLVIPPSAHLPKIHADSLRLKQVLLNLLSNAIKFTPSKGSVTLDAVRGPQGSVVIRVADTGIGMAPEDIPKALSPFGQLENSLARRHTGTGLGLPLSKALVELHGGQLDVSSVQGKGTTVSIVLPGSRVILA